MNTVEKGGYSVPQAAEWLGVSADTVRREIKAGRLPAVYIRGSRVIPAKALQSLIDNAPPEPVKA